MLFFKNTKQLLQECVGHTKIEGLTVPIRTRTEWRYFEIRGCGILTAMDFMFSYKTPKISENRQFVRSSREAKSTDSVPLSDSFTCRGYSGDISYHVEWMGNCLTR